MYISTFLMNTCIANFVEIIRFMDRISPEQIRHIYLMLIWSAAATTISMFLHTLKFKKMIGPKAAVIAIILQYAQIILSFYFWLTHCDCSTYTTWHHTSPRFTHGWGSQRCSLSPGIFVFLHSSVLRSTLDLRRCSSFTNFSWHVCSTDTALVCCPKTFQKSFLQRRNLLR